MATSSWLDLPQLMIEPPDPMKCHHLYGLLQAAATFHPDPNLFGDAAGISGMRTTGSTIFDPNETVVIWDCIIFHDAISTNPTLTFRRATDQAVVTRLDGLSNFTPIRIPFPFAIKGGFELVSTSAFCSFQVTWQRYTDI